MNINDMYPSKYIKADDIMGQQVPVTVMSVNIEEIADKEHKPVMRFVGKEKGMVLNKTNALTCSHVWGDDTVIWQGQRATLLAAPVMFQGKQVMGLQILPTAPQQPQAQPQQQPAQQQQTYQQQDAGYQQQFQKPGPHDVVKNTRTQAGPGGLVPAAQQMEALAQDIETAAHAVDVAGDLDDLPF
jgi:hypothetical protein